MEKFMENRKIIIIKIGSRVLSTTRKKIDEYRVCQIRDQVISLNNMGFEVILVVSGAVAFGSRSVSVTDDVITRRAAAGVGQVIVSHTFQSIFLQRNLNSAQILLTQDSFASDTDRESFRKILDFYLSSGIVPLINENDVIELNCFGGNDFLAKEIAVIMGAQQLLILSTWEKSFFGIGGGEAKKKVISDLNSQNVKAKIIDGKERNCILENFL
jgi:glutamate 5-kinase